MAKERFDYKDKTYKEVIDILGYGKPFRMIISNEKDEPIIYPVDYKFTKDKDFVYITAIDSILGDSHSFRINLDAQFGYEIEV